MSGRFGDLGPGFGDFSLGVNEDGTSDHTPGFLAVHLLQLPGSVRLEHLSVGIGKQTDPDTLFFDEFLMGLDGILAHTPDHRIKLLEFFSEP